MAAARGPLKANKAVTAIAQIVQNDQTLKASAPLRHESDARKGRAGTVAIRPGSMSLPTHGNRARTSIG